MPSLSKLIFIKPYTIELLLSTQKVQFGREDKINKESH